VRGVQAETTEELKGLLDQAMRTIQDLQSRVRALEAQNAQKVPASAPRHGAAPTSRARPDRLAPRRPAHRGRTERRRRAGTPAADKAQVALYGQVMVDAIYDAKRMHPSWQATLRPSQIPGDLPCRPRLRQGRRVCA
jgi:hypothetical protein